MCINVPSSSPYEFLNSFFSGEKFSQFSHNRNFAIFSEVYFVAESLLRTK